MTKAEWNERMFDAMLTLACEEALDREYAEAKAYAEANPVIPSVDFHKRMEKLIRGGTGKPAQNKFKTVKKAYNAFSKVAAAALVLIALISLTAFAVPAVRVELLNVLLDIQDEYTSLRLDTSKGGSVAGKNLVVPWADAYIPTYIPEGYLIEDINMSALIRSINYVNAESLRIIYTEYGADVGMNLDTENAVVESITVHGYSAMLVSKNGVVSVAWSDGERLFLIISQLEREELLKVAEGVRIVGG